jgi:hypothetical protein
MRQFRAHFPCFVRRLAWLSLLVFLAGCRTTRETPLFVAVGPGWRVQEGQAIWRPGREYPELAGELVVASHEGGCCSIEFSKTPLPLVLAQTTRTNWLIDFPPRRLRFTGRQPAPSRLAWLHLSAALAGEPVRAGFRFTRKSDGGWRLENTRTGETMEGFLGP